MYVYPYASVWCSRVVMHSMNVYVQYVGNVPVVLERNATVGTVRKRLAKELGTRPCVLRFRHKFGDTARVLNDDEPGDTITDAFQVPVVCSQHKADKQSGLCNTQ